MARRFGEGAERYGENNWQKGVQERAYVLDRLNHAFEHLMRIRDNVVAGNHTTTDDDHAAVILNVIFAMPYAEAKPTYTTFADTLRRDLGEEDDGA